MVEPGYFSRGKIYKIVSIQTEKIYVGSTCAPLIKRLMNHKQDIKFLHKFAGTTRRISSEYILQFPDAKIELIEEYPCGSWAELRAREQYWIDFNKDIVVNVARASCLYWSGGLRDAIIVCECGHKIRSIGMANHKLSKKHRKIMKLIYRPF